MTNAFFLNWLADRIVHVYGESEHVDFVTKLRGIAAGERAGDSKAITALSGMVKAFGSGAAFFLNWIADRIVHVYGESEHVDFVTKLRGIAAGERAGDSKAITALSGMVKAFGSGVQAANTEQAGALTEAYACIEADLRAKRPEAEPAHDAKPDVKPIVWDNEPVKADRSVGDVAKDWPGGRVTLADYVERNKGNRVRIEFEDNSELDRVCTIERIGSIMYFWVLDDQAEHGGRFSVAFCDVHTITRIPNRAVTPAAWPTFSGPTIKEFLADKLGKFVKITLKNGSDTAGMLDQGGTFSYFWLKTRDYSQNIYFSDVADVKVVPSTPAAFPATMHPYTKEEPAVLPDSWEKDDAARAAVDEIEKCARANIGVRVAIKFSDEKAGSAIGTIRTVTHSRYVCVEEDGANGTFMLNEIESIEPIAVTDNWPGGGVSLNSYLNARVGKLVTVNYGESKDQVTGELFRNPSQPSRYRLLLRTGSEAVDISLVWGVTCGK